ncbi:hypothetical protein SHI21_11625 [Bacteriovorax sp. PP10]|uniref:Uncharacterized protein n=1 Tax=Bacteriovorax antarcticus TaxID=3088717 RepID=A0ABU5VVA3_9BACT|nr:hypothetical protein [Bacteriovorax sp. PP10]MEA9356862.1 hypothetical protein [Bacteriovorax sp. PP10]
MMSDHQVLLGKKVEQELKNLPLQIIMKFRGWIDYVELQNNEIQIIKVIEVHKHDY